MEREPIILYHCICICKMDNVTTYVSIKGFTFICWMLRTPGRVKDFMKMINLILHNLCMLQPEKLGAQNRFRSERTYTKQCLAIYEMVAERMRCCTKKKGTYKGTW